jgi:hypothetical protein
MYSKFYIGLFSAVNLLSSVQFLEESIPEWFLVYGHAFPTTLTGYTASNGMVNVDDELIRTWNTAVVA